MMIQTKPSRGRVAIVSILKLLSLLIIALPSFIVLLMAIVVFMLASVVFSVGAKWGGMHNQSLLAKDAMRSFFRPYSVK